MDQEEFLEERPIVTDSRGKFTTKSADTFANNGRGKLNEDQLEERAILHGKNQVTGIPSVQEIVNHWLKKYGVTMTIQSEYEWVRNNSERIDRAVAKMSEEGSIGVVAVSNQTIANKLAVASRNILDTISLNKKSQEHISGSIRDFKDPYKQIGCRNKEEYWASEGDDRKKYDKRLDHIIKLHKVNVDTLRTVSANTSEQGKLLVDMLKVVAEINKSGQVMDANIEKMMREEIKKMGLIQQKKKDLKKENPLEPVSDEERIN